MSNVDKSRHSPHSWRNKPRCKLKVERIYGVAQLTILAQEQSRKLLMHCVYGTLDLQKCLCTKDKIIFQSNNIAYLLLIWVHSVFSNTLMC